MSDMEATKIEAEVWDDDTQVQVDFRWDRKGWMQPVRVDSRDGKATLWLFLEDAQELHRKLGAALDKQAWADAGHPDEEQLMEEAEARGDPAKEPSDAVLRSGPGNVDEIITSHVSAHVKTEHRGSGP